MTCTLILLLVVLPSLVFSSDIVPDSDSSWCSNITEWRETVNLPDYDINTALLVIYSTLNKSLTYWTQTTDCVDCPLRYRYEIPALGSYPHLQDSLFPVDLLISVNNNTSICSGELFFKERGEYWLIVYESSQTECVLSLYNDPPNIYLPLVYEAVLFIVLAVIWIVLKHLYRNGKFQRCSLSRAYEVEPAPQVNCHLPNKSTVDQYNMDDLTQKKPAVVEEPKRERLRSLDTFRGLSLIIMMFVNFGYRDTFPYKFLQHVTWDGLALADIVFPWFIWIMGTSMIFSFRGLRKRNTPTLMIVKKILIRSFWLFVIGLCLGARNVSMENIRIPGVLQRFAITYLCVAFTHLAFGNKSLESRNVWWDVIRDIVPFWPEWLVMFSFIGVFMGLTYGLAEPGCEKGYLGPGGLHENETHYRCAGGAAGYIDRWFFGENHMWFYNAIKWTYESPLTHDPEGILGSLTSIFMCYLGLQAGKILVAFKGTSSRTGRWLIWALLTTALGVGLCEGQWTGGFMPINKNLWSLSFVLVCAGTAFLLFLILYLLIDVWNIWTGAPFIYPGMNSILIYVGHSIFAEYFPIYWILPDTSLHWQGLIMDTWSICFWLIVAYIMYRKKFFFSL